MTLVSFWLAHLEELGRLAGQHVVLVLVSTGIAVALGIPAGVLAVRRPRLGRPLLLLASVAQTIPSLALLGFLLPLPFIGGVGPRTALVALTLYALLPIVRTTAAGLRSIDPSVIEAGVAMGMTSRQLLTMVELPLAVPSIVAGIRVATVVGVGTATIAAAIGAGGLGEYIFRGLSMVDATTILAGAIPAAALALVADGLLAWLERRLQARRGDARAIGLPVVAALVVGAALLSPVYARSASGAVVVGSKNFTEQVDPRRDRRPGPRGRRRAGRPEAESRRDVHLRSRAALGRHRRVRGVHRHGRHRDLPAAGRARLAGDARSARASSMRPAA